MLEYGPGSGGTPNIDDVILLALLIGLDHFWLSTGDFAANKYNKNIKTFKNDMFSGHKLDTRTKRSD